MYLYKGGRDTIFRIHGTNQPWTIGLNMSSGCIRMMNKDVEHLYSRAQIGAKVIVIGRATSRVLSPLRIVASISFARSLAVEIWMLAAFFSDRQHSWLKRVAIFQIRS